MLLYIHARLFFYDNTIVTLRSRRVTAARPEPAMSLWSVACTDRGVEEFGGAV
jgi:hypothetical protein